MQHHIPTAHVLSTAKWIGRGAYLIALIGVVASYGTQVALLLDHEVGLFSFVIPATIDVLAICCALALQLPDLDKGSRKLAGWILTITMVVSVTANVLGGHNMIARLAHAWPVIAYLFGELLANRVRTYAARLAAAEKAAAVSAVLVAPAQPEPAAISPVETPVTVAELESPDLPEAPVSPAIPTAPKAARKPSKARDAYGPRDGDQYSERHDRRLRNGR